MSDEAYVKYVNGVPRRYNPKRTVGQAIGDAVAAAANFAAPHSVAHARQRTNQNVEDAETGRMRSNQGTDRNNGY